MVKSCCAVGCSNRYFKGCGLKFSRFPQDPERRRKWIAAVNRKDWEPTEFTWICSTHFVGGQKSDDPTTPAYVPSLFEHVKSPMKRKIDCDWVRYERVSECKKRRVEAQQKEQAPRHC